MMLKSSEKVGYPIENLIEIPIESGRKGSDPHFVLLGKFVVRKKGYVFIITNIDTHYISSFFIRATKIYSIYEDIEQTTLY